MILESTPIGEVLAKVEDVNCKNFYRRYQHDFVRLAHQCTHKNPQHESQEYEVYVILILYCTVNALANHNIMSF